MKGIIEETINLQHIENELIKRKGELEEQLAKLHKEGLPLKPIGNDTADQTQLVMQEVLKISLHDQEFNEYKTIINALKRIKEGDYGICIDCSQAISPKRLIAYPDATRCIICQELLEEGTVQ